MSPYNQVKNPAIMNFIFLIISLLFFANLAAIEEVITPGLTYEHEITIDPETAKPLSVHIMCNPHTPLPR